MNNQEQTAEVSEESNIGEWMIVDADGVLSVYYLDKLVGYQCNTIGVS